MKRISAVWLLLLLPLVWLAPLLGDPARVHSAPGAEYSDLIVAHWPSAEFVRSSLIEFGEIPLWNPHTLGGTPFAADPLSGLYYPPLWLALILPAPLAFNILFFLHLAFAGAGAYMLAKREGAGLAGGWAGKAGPLLAGIAFGGLPKLVAHIAAGHLTLVLAVSWTPWLLIAAREAVERRKIRRWALAGLLAGIIFLIDPRWLIPSALAAVGYAFSLGGLQPERPRRAILLEWVKHLAVFALFAGALAAVLALPMAQFVSLSTRANLSGAESTVLSLPFSSLIGLLFAGIGGSIEWVVYPGVVVLALALASLLFSPSPKVILERGSGGEGERGGEESCQERGKGDGAAFWWFLLLISIFLSLGSNLPGYSQLLDAVPAAGLLRVPPRWMFLAGLALAMLAARGLTRLESLADGRGIIKKAGFALAAGGLILAVAARTMDLPAVIWQDALVWGALGLILFAGFFSKNWIQPATLALVVLAVIDLAIADARMIDPHPAASISADAARAAQMLAADADAYRVYSPSASIPQLAAVQNGVRSLDGVAPLMLASTAETVSMAARVPLEGYSVTLPAFETGSPDTDNRNAIPDWALLGLLDVRYMASAYPIPSAMLAGCRLIGGIQLCKNMVPASRVWVAEGLDAWARPIPGREVRIELDSPNRIRLTATGPGIVILSEAWYPAWHATVDGKSAGLMEAGGWWRAVVIGPGEHVVEMTYDPVLFQIGLGIAALAVAAYWMVRRWDV